MQYWTNNLSTLFMKSFLREFFWGKIVLFMISMNPINIIEIFMSKLYPVEVVN